MPNAPLELVLVQIRWPEHGRFTRDFRALALDLGDRLDNFPLFNEITETGMQITPEGVTPISGETAYQWRSVDDVWCVHLTKRFVSIFCSRHENYKFSELQEHLSKVTELLGEVLQVRTIERIGIRYVNRITDTDLLATLSEVFDPAILGFTQLDTTSGTAELISSFNQAVYRAGDASLHVRTGKLAPGDTVDPAVVPVDKDSWVLDLDASSEQRAPYEIKHVAEKTGQLADAAYDFFKSILLEGAEQRLDGAT